MTEQQGQVTYYQLVEVGQDALIENNYARKARKSLSHGMCCIMFAWMLLSVAATAPLWTVAGLSGSGTVLGVQYSVDFHVGTGIFLKNVCFGGSTPEQSFLEKFGLSCDGVPTLKDCDYDDNGNLIPGNDECDKIRSAQVLSLFASNLCFLCLLFACCASSGSPIRLTIASIFGMIAGFASISVLSLMERTDMMNHEWNCQTILGADLCYTPGPAVPLQVSGILCCFIGSLALMISGYFTRMSYPIISRQQIPTGVVIV